MISVVLYRNAKAFYKVFKLFGTTCMTGYSYDGSTFYPDSVSNMASNKRFSSYSYPLIGQLKDDDILL